MISQPSNAINIKFPEPFTVVRQGYQPLSLTFDGKPVYQFLFDGDMEEHKLELPSKVVLGVNTDSNDPVEVTIKYASDPTFKRKMNRTTSENISHIKCEPMKSFIM